MTKVLQRTRAGRGALALVVVGLGLVAAAWWAYGDEISGSICLDGWRSSSTGSGRCSNHGGVAEDVNVDTLVGVEVDGVGTTKWPAFALGLGAIAGGSTLAWRGRDRDERAEPHRLAPAQLDLDGEIVELHVRIEARAKGYAVEVTTPSGASRRTLRNSPLPEDRGVGDLTTLTRGPERRRFGSRQSRAVATFGQTLFEAVFEGALERAYRDSVDYVRTHNAVLRVVLEVDDVYGDIPWEYLFDPDRGSFLARSRETTLVRLHRTTATTRHQQPIDRLRILAMTAAPRDLPRLDLAGDRDGVEQALRPAIEAGEIEVRFVDGATQADLNRALVDFRPHVFYFAGHGEWCDDRDDGVILFETEAGRADEITGDRLGTMLNQADLRLAIFNSCHASTPSKHDRFAGITASLLSQGIPAAIGMQFRFDDQAAAQFGSALLGSLAEAAPLDRAVAEARIAVYTLPSEIEWATPVLATRVPLDRVLPRAGEFRE